MLVGLPQGVGGLAIVLYIIFHFSYYFHNAHQVLVGLPQGVGGLTFFIYNTHHVLVGLPQGVDGLAILFDIF
jgi:hypothetical protein